MSAPCASVLSSSASWARRQAVGLARERERDDQPGVVVLELGDRLSAQLVRGLVGHRRVALDVEVDALGVVGVDHALVLRGEQVGAAADQRELGPGGAAEARDDAAAGGLERLHLRPAGRRPRRSPGSRGCRPTPRCRRRPRSGDEREADRLRARIGEGRRGPAGHVDVRSEDAAGVGRGSGRRSGTGFGCGSGTAPVACQAGQLTASLPLRCLTVHAATVRKDFGARPLVTSVSGERLTAIDTVRPWALAVPPLRLWTFEPLAS